MTKRVTVSIPDELHEKMEKWKDSLNYSGIFQEAVSEVVDRKERFTADIKEGLDMEELAERFMKEEGEDMKKWEEQGRKDALLWLKVARRKELMRALKIWERYDDRNENPLDDSILGEYFKEIMQDHEFDEPERDGWLLHLPDDFERWLDGWTDAVAEAWDEINKIIEQKEADKIIQQNKANK